MCGHDYINYQRPVTNSPHLETALSMIVMLTQDTMGSGREHSHSPQPFQWLSWLLLGGGTTLDALWPSCLMARAVVSVTLIPISHHSWEFASPAINLTINPLMES